MITLNGQVRPMALETAENPKYLSCEGLNAYCLYCFAGHEEKVARVVNERYRAVMALPVMQEKHHSKNGVRSIVRQAMLPGYVFLFAPDELPVKRILRDSKAIRFLMDSNGEYRLLGDDLEYARWVFRYQGLIGRSKAIRLGSTVRILEGPLKDLEGQIQEISKKNRNGRVEIHFMGRAVSVWLPFEWVEPEEEQLVLPPH